MLPMINWLRLESLLQLLAPGTAVLGVGTGGGAFFGYLLDLLAQPGASPLLIVALRRVL